MKIKEYVTEYYIDGELYGASVFSTSFEEAQKLADQNKRGEIVVGFIP
ncbi:hypothetical protein [Flavobacterium alkalisoli]|nr:hypothetical protein [Flavobacterium alkalisoli]